MATFAEARAARSSMKKARSRDQILFHLLLIPAAFVMLYPILWMASSSLKPPTEIFTTSNLIPNGLHLENYERGWAGAVKSFDVFLRNSFVISILAVIGNVFACSLTAYAFARLRFRFKKVLFALMLVTIMLPYHATLIPQYVLFNSIGWMNTMLPIVVPKFLAIDAFFIFLMVQFIRGIPTDIDEAAAIDGAGPIRVYFYIILPLLGPALVTTALFTFIWTYEDFLTPLVYLTSMDNYTVPQGLRLFMASTGISAWGPMLAMSLISLVPVFVLFFLFQRRLVDGIATTGLKG
jgi:multiple sugar transport system permease protein